MNRLKMILILSQILFISFAQQNDPRNILNAIGEIPDENYCDQPYIVKTANGDWLVVLTTGVGKESQKGQHMVASISKDKGKTWSSLIDIESANLPASSWGIPYITPYGRIYVFYTFNANNVTMLNDKPLKHNSELGWYCFKYSDDNGLTWSERHKIPMRQTTVDYINPFYGDVQLFWGISKPFSLKGSMYFAFTKMAIHPQDMGEGFLYKSDNINTEKDVLKLHWTMLPEGDEGIADTRLGETQEEHNIIPLNNGNLYCLFRTAEGYPADCYSSDGGKTWTTPQYAVYADGHVIKNPRACPRVFKTSRGKYLLWYHNNNMKGYKGFRNPAWISGGIEKKGRIYWSQPEVLLYAQEGQMMSYPDLIEEDGQYWITETQKEFARIHKVNVDLLNGLWSQELNNKVSKDGIVLQTNNIDGINQLKINTLPSLESGAFSIDLWIKCDELTPGEVLIDKTDALGNGWNLSVTHKHTMQIAITFNDKRIEWETDPGIIKCGKPQHIVFIIDGAADLITSVVNGRLCDGGRYRYLGWTRFDKGIMAVNDFDKIIVNHPVHGKILQLRLYDRYLTTSQAIANYKAGIN